MRAAKAIFPSSQPVEGLAAEAPAVARRQEVQWLAVALIAAALLPPLLVPIPAMVDYVNHLARMDILSRAGTPAANPFYETHWAFYPNLAMDLVVPAVAKLVGAVTATKLFLILSQVLVLTGSMALERVVKGRISLSPFVASLFLYSVPFAFGFLNFEFGVGVALWSLAAMMRADAKPWPLRLGVHSACCALLFVSHLFAFGIYGAALGLIELSRASLSKPSFRETGLRMTLLAAPAVVLFAAMFAAGGAVGSAGNDWRLQAKPYVLLHILSGYNYWLSAGCLIGLTAVLYRLAKSGAVTLDRSGLFIAAGFAGLFLAIPSKMFGTAYVDLRVLPAAALILPAFAEFRLQPGRAAFKAAAPFAAAAFANIALVLYVWMSYAPEYKALIASFGQLPNDARVFAGESGAGRDPPKDLTEYPIYHAPTLATAFADAFVPTLFTDEGKQPLRAKNFIRGLDIGYGGPAPMPLLQDLAAGKNLEDAPAYLRHWPRDFDFVYVVGPLRPNPMPDILREVASGGRFTLYRIDRAGAESAR